MKTAGKTDGIMGMQYALVLLLHSGVNQWELNSYTSASHEYCWPAKRSTTAIHDMSGGLPLAVGHRWQTAYDCTTK
jgi:hypothetical protein